VVPVTIATSLRVPARNVKTPNAVNALYAECAGAVMIPVILAVQVSNAKIVKNAICVEYAAAVMIMIAMV